MNWKFLRRLGLGVAAIIFGAALTVWGVETITAPFISAGCLAVVLGFWYMVDTERVTW